MIDHASLEPWILCLLIFQYLSYNTTTPPPFSIFSSLLSFTKLLRITFFTNFGGDLTLVEGFVTRRVALSASADLVDKGAMALHRLINNGVGALFLSIVR
jgi:hypothetical protein